MYKISGSGIHSNLGKVEGRSEKNTGAYAKRPEYPWIKTGSICIDDLVAWAYRDQRVMDHKTVLTLNEGERAAGNYFVKGSTRDGTADIERSQELGVRVDGGGITSAVHPYAEAIGDIVEMLSRELRALVISHGLKGTRPDDGTDDRPRYRPLNWEIEGKKSMTLTYRKDGGAKRVTNIPYTPVYVTNTADEVALKRDIWTNWVTGLALIADELKNCELPFLIFDIAEGAAPWFKTGLMKKNKANK
jgi:hypothetical protein